MKTRPYALWLLLMVIGACGCCSSKSSLLNRLRGDQGPALGREAEIIRSINALNHFSMAQQLARSGQGEGAVRELKAALKEDPGSAYLREVLADLLFQMQKPDQALRYVEEAIEINPERADAYSLLGQIQLSRNKFPEAEEAFRRALDLEPNNSEILSNLAQAMVLSGKPDQALDLLNEYASRHPADPEPFFLIGLIFQSSGRTEQALANYYQVIKLDRSHYPALNSIVELELKARNFPAAIQAARQLLEYYPGDSGARLTLVDVLLFMQMKDEAMDVLEEGKTSGDAKPDWWLKKGYIYLFDGRVDEAKAEFEGALGADAESVEAVFALGLTAMRQNDLIGAASYFGAVPPDSESYASAQRQLAVIALREDAPDRGKAIMEKLYQERKDDPEVVVSYSAILRDLEEYDQADRMLTAAIKKNPEDEGLLYERAMLYYVQGRGDDAIALVQKMLESDPDNAQALNFIGYTYAEMGVKLDEAEAMVRRALELSPNAGFIMDSLGWVYYQRGDYQEALSWLTKAMAIEGEDSEIAEHAADCYRALKQKGKAVEYYEKALNTVTSVKVRRRIEAKLEELK